MVYPPKLMASLVIMATVVWFVGTAMDTQVVQANLIEFKHLEDLLDTGSPQAPESKMETADPTTVGHRSCNMLRPWNWGLVPWDTSMVNSSNADLFRWVNTPPGHGW